MRDIVSYHRARLAYDADDVLANPDNPERRRMLQEIAEEESRGVLRRAYQAYAKQPPEVIVNHLLESRNRTARHLAVLFFAWHIGNNEQALAAWLEKNKEPVTEEASKLFRAYQNPRLTPVDYAYLLSVHPLDLWCATEFRREPKPFLGPVTCTKWRRSSHGLRMAAQCKKSKGTGFAAADSGGEGCLCPDVALLAKAWLSL